MITCCTIKNRICGLEGRGVVKSLDHPCFFEGLVCAVFVEGAHTFGGDIDGNAFAGFWYKDAFLGEVDFAAYTARWVELRSTHAV